jgi:hypothetical protein
MLTDRLIQAAKDGDYSAARFAPVEARIRSNFAYFDRLVSCSYISFSNYELWNAWHRIWMVGSVRGGAGLLEIVGRWLSTGDPAAFALCEQAPHAGMQASELPQYKALFDAAAGEVEAVGDHRRSPAEATSRRSRGACRRRPRAGSGRSRCCAARAPPSEVSRIARYGALPRILLEIILGNATWLQVPEVRRALLANPRLGTDQILKVLRLTARHELRLAAIQTAYPHAVRQAAKLLLRGEGSARVPHCRSVRPDLLRRSPSASRPACRFAPVAESALARRRRLG